MWVAVPERTPSPLLRQKLHAMVLDLPKVLPIAERHIVEAGLAGRSETRPGDLSRDHFGAAFNLVLLSAVCPMLSPEEHPDVLQRCFEALAPQGRLVIQDFVLESHKTAPKQAALFALNVGTTAGSTYSGNGYTAWLAAVGFEEIR